MNRDRLSFLAGKIKNHQRIDAEEACFLYTDAPLGWLGMMAHLVRTYINGSKVFYNKNIHLEPTNVCLYQCEFCSFKRNEGDEGSWDYTTDQMLEQIARHLQQGITEVHITGGVYPGRDLVYYENLVKSIKVRFPDVHIKAFTAIELNYMSLQAGISVEEGIARLKQAGLGSIPGGGAEIFDPDIRRRLCPEKGPATLWLRVHQKVHEAGLFSNATMLYGHIENYQHRVEHMSALREIQDETGGFNAFIPLKFRKQNNFMSHLPELSLSEDMRNYAVARIFLDNIPHLKAYWPMIGKDAARLALHFGADDLDGTISDTTKIYTMAGSEEQRPEMTVSEIRELIENENFVPVERNSQYFPVT